MAVREAFEEAKPHVVNLCGEAHDFHRGGLLCNGSNYQN